MGKIGVYALELLHIVDRNPYKVPRKTSAQEADVGRPMQRLPIFFAGTGPVIKPRIRALRFHRQLDRLVRNRNKYRQKGEFVRRAAHHPQHLPLSFFMGGISVQIIVFIKV